MPRAAQCQEPGAHVFAEALRSWLSQRRRAAEKRRGKLRDSPAPPKLRRFPPAWPRQAARFAGRRPARPRRYRRALQMSCRQQEADQPPWAAPGAWMGQPIIAHRPAKGKACSGSERILSGKGRPIRRARSRMEGAMREMGSAQRMKKMSEQQQWDLVEFVI